MNSKNSKTSDLRELLLNLNVKIDSRRIKRVLYYQILAFTISGKI